MLNYRVKQADNIRRTRGGRLLQEWHTVAEFEQLEQAIAYGVTQTAKTARDVRVIRIEHDGQDGLTVEYFSDRFGESA